MLVTGPVCSLPGEEAFGSCTLRAHRTAGPRDATGGRDGRGLAWVPMPREMLKRFLARRPRLTVEIARVPDGLRVYAIGDIHGRVDLLRRDPRLIIADAASAASPKTQGRGRLPRRLHRSRPAQPRGDRRAARRATAGLRERPPARQPRPRTGGFPRGSGSAAPPGCAMAATRRSTAMACACLRARLAEERLVLLRDRLQAGNAAAPSAVFRRHCRSPTRSATILFVHAGIDPDKPLDRQTPVDLLWIRERFLELDDDFGKMVVHGHSVTEQPRGAREPHRHRYRRLLYQCADQPGAAGNTRRFLSTGAVCDAVDD